MTIKRKYYAFVKHESGQTRTHMVWAFTFAAAYDKVRLEQKKLGDPSTSRITEIGELDLPIDSSVLRSRAKG